jgi:hypothetical protein
MVVVQLRIVQQSRLEIGPAVEASLQLRFIDAAIEPLSHAIRLEVAWRRQATLGRDGRASYVECMFTACFLVFGGKAVGKLRTVVSQDSCRSRWVRPASASAGNRRCRPRSCSINVHEDPASGTIYGDEPVAARSVIRHLLEVLDVDVE